MTTLTEKNFQEWYFNSEDLNDDVYICFTQYGTQDIAIFDSWDDVNSVMQEVARTIAPDCFKDKDYTLDYGNFANVSEAFEKSFKAAGFDGIPSLEYLMSAEICFNDEYVVCSSCGTGIHLHPSYYGDIPQYFFSESFGDYVCGDCFQKDENLQRMYLIQIVGNPERANTLLSAEQLEQQGFSLLEDGFESGFHHGQTDNPKEIYNRLKEEHPEYSIVFSIDSVGQFDTHYSVYVSSDFLPF